MTMHVLPLRRRMIAFAYPLIILVLAALTAPTFIEAGLAWWPVFIFCLPALLAIVICIEFWNVAIGFDDAKVHYRSVGYRLTVPWSQVSAHERDGKVTLRVSEGKPQFHMWLGAMYGVLGILMPYRARFASGWMSIIPLWYFSTASDDTVMTEFRRLTTSHQA